MSLEQRFTEAADKVKNLKTKPDSQELLELYGLYKQATVGDVNTDKPWAVQVEASAKWGAWNSRKGMTKEEAQEKYIATVDSLVTKYGL